MLTQAQVDDYNELQRKGLECACGKTLQAHAGIIDKNYYELRFRCAVCGSSYLRTNAHSSGHKTGRQCPTCSSMMLIMGYDITKDADLWKCTNCGANHATPRDPTKAATYYQIKAKTHIGGGFEKGPFDKDLMELRRLYPSATLDENGQIHIANRQERIAWFQAEMRKGF